MKCPHIVIVMTKASVGYLTCSGEPDRPVAAWVLDELSGIWCKPNISSEDRNHRGFVLYSASRHLYHHRSGRTTQKSRVKCKK